jgi:hypothetical protein
MADNHALNVQYERRVKSIITSVSRRKNTLSKATWWRKGIGRHAPHVCVNLCIVKYYMYERMRRRNFFFFFILTSELVKSIDFLAMDLHYQSDKMIIFKYCNTVSWIQMFGTVDT